MDWQKEVPDRVGYWALSYCNKEGAWSAPLVVDIFAVGEGWADATTTDPGADDWGARFTNDDGSERRRWRFVGPHVAPPAEPLGPVPPPPPPVEYIATFRRVVTSEWRCTVKATNDEEAEKEARKAPRVRFNDWQQTGQIEELASIVKKEV